MDKGWKNREGVPGPMRGDEPSAGGTFLNTGTIWPDAASDTTNNTQISSTIVTHQNYTS